MCSEIHVDLLHLFVCLQLQKDLVHVVSVGYK